MMPYDNCDYVQMSRFGCGGGGLGTGSEDNMGDMDAMTTVTRFLKTGTNTVIV